VWPLSMSLSTFLRRSMISEEEVFHDHALGRRGGAGRRVSAHAFNLHDAEPAGAVWFQRRVIAQGGDFNSGLSRGLKNRVPLRRVHLIPVNGKGYFTHS